MPKLYITEYSTFGKDRTGALVQVPEVPAEREYSIDMDEDASTQSEEFFPKTTVVAVVSDVDCCLAWGPNPIAENVRGFLPAGAERVVAVKPGHRVAVIALEGI